MRLTRSLGKKTDLNVQKNKRSTMKTYNIVITAFQIFDKFIGL